MISLSRFANVLAGPLAAAAWLLAVVGPVRAAEIYRSDWTNQKAGPADLKDWSLGEGRFEIRDGWLTVVSDKSNPHAALKIRHDGDGTFRATVRGAAFCHHTALQARGVYQLEVNNQFGQLRLLRQIGGAGSWKQVAAADRYLDYTRRRDRFELRLTFAGRRVCGFVDGKKLIDYDDPAEVPPGGQFGLAGGWGSDLAWRDIQLTDQPDLAQWPVESFPTTAPADLVRVTWVWGLTADNIYFDDQPGGLAAAKRSDAGLQFKVVSPRRAKVRLVYRLIDVRQQPVATSREEVDLSAGQERALTVKFPLPGRGCFKVALYAGEADEDPARAGWVEDLGSFTVVSRAIFDRPVNADSYFGGHIDGINLKWHAEAARKLGVRWVRCHDMLQHTWWNRVQPDGPDQWKWADKVQATVDEAPLATLGEFLWTPKWASTRPDAANPAAFPPKNPDDFARYVAETVGHYRTSIRAWEVWNEPHFAGFWAGSPEQYARLLTVAYAAAKKADPACTVIGGGGIEVNRLAWVERMLAGLDGQPMDAFSVHYLWPENATERLAALRKLLAHRGIEVPIWDSEESVATTSFLDQHRRSTAEPEGRYHFRNACCELVRVYMEGIANGVKHVFYYELADPWRFGEFPKPRPPKNQIAHGMWDEGRMLRPIGAAHAAMAQVLEGKTFRKRVSSALPSPMRAFLFAGHDEAVAVCYAEFDTFARHERVPIALPEGARPDELTIVDFMGNEARPAIRDGRFVLPMSREPVYLRWPGQAGEGVLEAMLKSAELGD